MNQLQIAQELVSLLGHGPGLSVQYCYPVRSDQLLPEFQFGAFLRHSAFAIHET